MEPTILTAKTYFWSPAGTASGRRNNEKRRVSEVASWFSEIGMQLLVSPGKSVIGRYADIVAEYSYSETCANVYNRLRVTVAGKRSNLTALRKLQTSKTRVDSEHARRVLVQCTNTLQEVAGGAR